MSERKSRREIELVVEALDGLPDEADGEEAVRRLGIDVKSWAGGIRSRVAVADAAARQRRFAQAVAVYEEDLAAFGRRSIEPRRSKEEQQQVLRGLIARVPKSAETSVHFHKFEEANADELAEMIRAVRHLLGEDDE